jgi:hypothetical protein
VVGTLLIGLTLHGIKTSGVEFTRATGPRLVARYYPDPVGTDFPTGCPARISPGKSALLPCTTATYTSATEPVDFAVLCQLVPSRRPSMWFLFISLQVSSSLPPPGRLPFQS